MKEPKREINPIIEKIIDTNKSLSEKQTLSKDHLTLLLGQNEKILTGITTGAVLFDPPVYTVILKKPIRNITDTIKYLREVLGGIELKEANRHILLDTLPREILRNCTKDRAMEIKERFESAGATIEIKLDERLRVFK